MLSENIWSSDLSTLIKKKNSSKNFNNLVCKFNVIFFYLYKSKAWKFSNLTIWKHKN